jgi:hypothetical protein
MNAGHMLQLQRDRCGARPQLRRRALFRPQHIAAAPAAPAWHDDRFSVSLHSFDPQDFAEMLEALATLHLRGAIEAVVVRLFG